MKNTKSNSKIQKNSTCTGLPRTARFERSSYSGALAIIAWAGALAGCSTTEIAYQKVDESTPVEATALKFVLQDSMVTLADATPQDPAKPSVKVTNGCKSGTWVNCFDAVAAASVMAPSKPAKHDTILGKPDPMLGVLHEAKAAAFPANILSTTTIKGTPVTSQPLLYTSIVVSYTNNTSTLITAAGTGAVTGFGIGGPWGAVGGAVISVSEQVAKAADYTVQVDLPNVKRPEPPLGLRLADYLCKGEVDGDTAVDLTEAKQGGLRPALYLPVAFSAADARPLADTSQLKRASNPTTTATSNCWHVLPNNKSVSKFITRPLDGQDDGTKPRAPGDGDGWLYRVVAKEGDPNTAPAGSVSAEEYFTVPSGHDFPVSVCRKVTVQLTWWEDFALSIDDTKVAQAPRVVSFDTVVADPHFVTKAMVTKGGTLNFKPDCGVNLSLGVDTSTADTITASVKLVQDLYNAQKSYNAAKKKK